MSHVSNKAGEDIRTVAATRPARSLIPYSAFILALCFAAGIVLGLIP